MSVYFTFPLQLDKIRDDCYIVTFPSLPEVVTQGSTIKRALHAAKNSLTTIVAYRIKNSIPIPHPAVINKHSHYITVSAGLVAKVQ